MNTPIGTPRKRRLWVEPSVRGAVGRWAPIGEMHRAMAKGETQSGDRHRLLHTLRENTAEGPGMARGRCILLL